MSMPTGHKSKHKYFEIRHEERHPRRFYVEDEAVRSKWMEAIAIAVREHEEAMTVELRARIDKLQADLKARGVLDDDEEQVTQLDPADEAAAGLEALAFPDAAPAPQRARGAGADFNSLADGIAKKRRAGRVPSRRLRDALQRGAGVFLNILSEFGRRSRT